MPNFGLVKDGAVVRCKEFHKAPLVTEGKWLPIRTTTPTYNPNLETLTGPTYLIADIYIAEIWTVVSNSLQSLVQTKLNKLAALRYQYEVGGTYFDIGSPPKTVDVDTSRDSFNRISNVVYAAHLSLTNDAPFAINWKMLDGNFYKLDALQFVDLYTTILIYYQKCFDNEMLLTHKINKCQTVSSLDAIDITQSWPTDCLNPPTSV